MIGFVGEGLADKEGTRPSDSQAEHDITTGTADSVKCRKTCYRNEREVEAVLQQDLIADLIVVALAYRLRK